MESSSFYYYFFFCKYLVMDVCRYIMANAAVTKTVVVGLRNSFFSDGSADGY